MLAALNKDGRIALSIHFETGKATIKPESQKIVGEIAALLKANPDLRVSIEGHTDNTGTPQGNKVLSEERAKAVVGAVVAQGVEAPRLSALGWGQDKPVADNATEDGRAKNRRVEVVKK
jgi:outer membrane protein OmpA-like peptidoglycan-associated protein